MTIDQELIHEKDQHEHFAVQPKKQIEHGPFIVDGGAVEHDDNPVKTPEVTPPTYDEVYKPYELKREETEYHDDIIPDFGFSFAPLPKAKPAPKPAVRPAPPAPAPGPAPVPAGHALKGGEDDIWGGYRAKYAGPQGTTARIQPRAFTDW